MPFTIRCSDCWFGFLHIPNHARIIMNIFDCQQAGSYAATNDWQFSRRLVCTNSIRHFAMWSLQVLLPVLFLAATALAATAIFVIWLTERRRHRKLINAHGALGRGLSSYHRTNLSADWHNYRHVGRPQNRLRRSVNVSSDEPNQDRDPRERDAGQPSAAVANNFQGPNAKDESPPAKRRKSLRQRLSTRSLSVPKTRRQRKIDKAITIDNTYPRSPLSAITEFTDTASTDRAPPANIPNPRDSKAMPHNALAGRRPSSTQWPLTNRAANSERPASSIGNSLEARQSLVAGAKSIEHQSTVPRPSMGSRSVSGLSCATTAPEEELPPLPLFASRSRGHQRLSSGSVDSVCSSVLESSSPTHEQIPYVNATDFQFRFPPPKSRSFATSGSSLDRDEVTFGQPVGRSVHSSLHQGLRVTGSGRHASRQAQHWTSTHANDHLLRPSKHA